MSEGAGTAGAGPAAAGARAAAAEIRRRRAEMVAGIASAALRLGDLVADGRAELVKVVVLAEAVPGVGKVRSRRLLDALGIAADARWGDLTPDVAGRVTAGLSALSEAPAATPPSSP